MRRLINARSLRWALVGLAALGVAGVVALGWRRRALTAELLRPRDLHGTGFVGAARCGACHAPQLASWRKTFHRTMTQEVSPVSSAHAETLAGDFAEATYDYDGVHVRMHRDAAGRPVMSFSRPGEPGTATVDAVVVRSVGSRRYQQYLTEVRGVLWRLPMAYHIEERRWFHMNGAFLTPDPDYAAAAVDQGAAAARDADGPNASPNTNATATPTDRDQDVAPRFGGGAFDRHVTRWNDNCVFCHNVAPNPGWDAARGVFRTTVAELGIACEACHGPGATHATAAADTTRRWTIQLSGTADPTIVNPRRLSPGRAADVCGRCHGQRISDDVGPIMAHGDPFVPGDDLACTPLRCGGTPLWAGSGGPSRVGSGTTGRRG